MDGFTILLICILVYWFLSEVLKTIERLIELRYQATKVDEGKVADDAETDVSAK